MPHKIIALTAVLLLLAGGLAQAAGPSCMESYHTTKSPACVDSTLENLRAKPAPTSDKGMDTAQGAVGFLAEVFRLQPQERSRILRRQAAGLEAWVGLEALCRAGLAAEAAAYAQKTGLAVELPRLEARASRPLLQVRPLARPADNDMLIGAYMASGDVQHLRNILENFTGAADSMVADALRLGLLNGRYGPGLVPPGRPKGGVAKGACQKYFCSVDTQAVLRLFTLSSAFWALDSIGRRDKGVQKTLRAFFEGSPRLKHLLAGESAAFGNYVSLAAVHDAMKNDPSIEAFLSGYEKLQPGDELLTALAQSPLFPKKQ